MLFNSLALSALLSAASASPLSRRESFNSTVASNSTAPDKYLSFDFISQVLTPGLDFRAIQVSIGSNNQTVLLKLDTTTSDLWVNSNVNDFCLAYYPVDDYFNNTSEASEWDSFNGDLESDFEDALEAFEQGANSDFLEEVATATTTDIASYLGERRSALASILSVQKASVTKKIGDFLSTATAAVEGSWSSFEAGLPSQANEIGQAITSTAALLAISAQATPSYITSCSSTNGAVYTYVAESGYADAEIFTYANSADEYSYEYSDAGASATDAGADSDNYSASDFATLEKRENGWEKFTSGAKEFFDDLKKRDEATTSAGHHSGHSHSAHGSASYGSKTYSATNSYHSGHHASSYTAASASSVQSSAFASATADVVVNNENYTIEASFHEFFKDCALYGVFNDSASSTFESSGDEFFVSSDYSSYGIIGTDNITINGVSVNTTFGVSDVSDSNIGVLGLGQTYENSTFESFPYVLAENGDILKPLYSLAISSFTSQITFGAINFDAFYGNLTLFPLLNDTEAIALTLSSISLAFGDEYDAEANSTEIASGKAPAIIDTTINNVLFPDEVLDAFVSTLNETFNVTYNENIDRYVITYNFTESYDDDNTTTPYDAGVVFEFQGTEYNIPLSSFLVPFHNTTAFFNETSFITGSDGEKSFYYDYEGLFDNYYDDSEISVNILSILPSNDSTVVLGLDFLTDNIFVVVDLEEGEVGLAEYSFIIGNEGKYVVIEDEIPGAIDTPYYSEFYGSDNVTELYV